MVKLTTSLEHLLTFLCAYQNTPNKCDLQTKIPTQMFLGRAARTTMDLLKKPVQMLMESDEYQNIQFNRRYGAVKREYHPGDMVYAEIPQQHEFVDSWTNC